MSRSNHVVIAGTGRAGTSFLVDFLRECGLDTGDPAWQERARAGHEHVLGGGHDLPLVVKDPWLWVYCREIDLETTGIEALIVPMRTLEDAAASRVLQERMAMTEHELLRDSRSPVWAHVPGGIVYSVSVEDQQRVLAVGFHHLLQWATQAQIPLILLDFPRIVDDVEYLVDALSPVLEGRTERTTAFAAHAAVARPSAVRIGVAADVAGAASRVDADLDRTALVHRIAELEAAHVEAQRELAAARQRLGLDSAAGAGVEADRAECLEAAPTEWDARVVKMEALPEGQPARPRPGLVARLVTAIAHSSLWPQGAVRSRLRPPR